MGKPVMSEPTPPAAAASARLIDAMASLCEHLDAQGCGGLAFAMGGRPNPDRIVVVRLNDALDVP